MGDRVDLDKLETLAAAAAPGPWEATEDDDTWQLLAGAYQILKAPKRHTPYAEYWPDAATSAYLAAADPQTVLDLTATARAARAFRDDVRAALSPGRWRGFDGPDGVSKDEVLDDVVSALSRYDRATGARV